MTIQEQMRRQEDARARWKQRYTDPVFTFQWTVWCLMWKCVGWHHAHR